MPITLQNVSLAWPPLTEPLTCAALIKALAHVTQADRRLLVRQGDTSLTIEAPPLDVFRVFTEIGGALFLRKESNTRAFLGGKAQQRLLVQREGDRLQLTVEAGSGPAQKPLVTNCERFFADLHEAAQAWVQTQMQAASTAQDLAQDTLRIACAETRLLQRVAEAAQDASVMARNEATSDELARVDFVTAYQRVFGALPPFGTALLQQAETKNAAVWIGPPLLLDLQPRERLLKWLSDQAHHAGAANGELFCAYFSGGRLIAARSQNGVTSTFEDAWSMPRDSFADVSLTHERFSYFWHATQSLADGVVLHYGQLSPLVLN